MKRLLQRYTIFIFACLSPFKGDTQIIELDQSFSSNGHITVTYVEGLSSQTDDMTTLSDGRILVVGGTATPGQSRSAIAWSLLPDGDDDPEFNEGSPQLLPVPGMITFVEEAIRLPNDHTLLLLGQDANPENQMALQVIQDDGSADTSFGVNGIAKPDLPLVYSAVRDMLLLPDGSILVAGYGEATANEPHQFMVIKFYASGDIDTSFGTNGIVLLPVGDDQARLLAAVIQPDGKLVLAGHGIFNGKQKLVVARLLDNGMPDQEFAGHGIYVFEETAFTSQGYCVDVQPDGKIVVAGHLGISSSDADWLALRLMQNGTLDPTFGNNGFCRFIPGNLGDQPRSMLLQPDGKIMMGGYTHSNGPKGAASALVRLTADGEPDQSFGVNGLFEINITSFGNAISSLEWAPDGKLLACGYIVVGNYTKGLVIRFNTDVVLHATAQPSYLDDIRIYPNPATNQVTIDVESTQQAKLSILMLDVTGKTVQTMTHKTNIEARGYSETFDLKDNLIPGQYYIQLTSGNKSCLKPLAVVRND